MVCIRVPIVSVTRIYDYLTWPTYIYYGRYLLQKQISRNNSRWTKQINQTTTGSFSERFTYRQMTAWSSIIRELNHVALLQENKWTGNYNMHPKANKRCAQPDQTARTSKSWVISGDYQPFPTWVRSIFISPTRPSFLSKPSWFPTIPTKQPFPLHFSIHLKLLSSLTPVLRLICPSHLWQAKHTIWKKKNEKHYEVRKAQGGHSPRVKAHYLKWAGRRVWFQLKHIPEFRKECYER